MNIVTVENKRCVLGNVHPIVHKIFGRIVGCTHPKRRVHALHLRIYKKKSVHLFMYGTHFFDDGSDIWQVLFVFGRWPIISANHRIELCMRLGKDIGI
jgi:hypothetical protein